MHSHIYQKQDLKFFSLGSGDHVVSTQNGVNTGAATIEIRGDGKAQVRVHAGVLQIVLSGKAKFKICSPEGQVLVALAGPQKTTLELTGRGCLRAFGHCRIKAFGDLDVELRGNIHAEVGDLCRVFAFNACEVVMLNRTYGEFRDRSKAHVFGNGYARIFDHAQLLRSGKHTHTVFIVH